MEFALIDPVSGKEVAQEIWALFVPSVLSALRRGWRMANQLAACSQAVPSPRVPNALQAESLTALALDDRWGTALVIHGVLKTLRHLPSAYLDKLVEAHRQEQENLTASSEKKTAYNQYEGLFALDRSVRDHVSELLRCQVMLDRAVLRARPEWSVRIGVSVSITLPLSFNGDARHGLTYALCECVGQLAENDQLARLLDDCTGSARRKAGGSGTRGDGQSDGQSDGRSAVHGANSA